ncbi:MAG: hypothetical protein KME20_25660 [Kaiparowitsia implicata GSE-PSE-MK54-09C]|jgi:hypothetical protein|nr:hypothetical protein [Kaiparowitsia implicata GSE-PSE-MK54-09C]
MEEKVLPTEVILNHPRQTLGHVHLDWMPQPGAYLDLDGETYAVLERRHRYQLRGGRYQLERIALYVQRAPCTHERSWVAGRWVIGDADCRFNAQSEVLRCAVAPLGPCKGCRFFEPR